MKPILSLSDLVACGRENTFGPDYDAIRYVDAINAHLSQQPEPLRCLHTHLDGELCVVLSDASVLSVASPFKAHIIDAVQWDAVDMTTSHALKTAPFQKILTHMSLTLYKPIRNHSLAKVLLHGPELCCGFLWSSFDSILVQPTLHFPRVPLTAHARMALVAQAQQVRA